jgi:hypothetical protein
MTFENAEDFKAYEKELKQTGQRWCCECRAGDHDNYSDGTFLYLIRDPETKQIYRRGYICTHHIEMFNADGFLISKL